MIAGSGPDLLSGAVGAAVVFAGTDVDDLLVLTVLFVSARTTGRPRAWQIVAGQYAGIAVLVGVSAVAAAGLLLVPDPWPGLLGLLPIALGVRALLAPPDADDPGVVRGALGVAGVTVANGADNIAVYVPVLRALGPGDAWVPLTVFAVLVAVWCAIAAWLGSRPRITRLVQRAGDRLVPIVFIGIGGVILVTSGVLARLADLAG